MRFQTEGGILSVNKIEITGQNAFHGDLFEIKENHESSKNEKNWFEVLLQIFCSWFNPEVTKYVYLRFSNIV